MKLMTMALLALLRGRRARPKRQHDPERMAAAEAKRQRRNAARLASARPDDFVAGGD